MSHRIKDFDCLHQFFPCERKVMPIQEVRKATFNLQQASLGFVPDFHPFTSLKIVCLHSWFAEGIQQFAIPKIWAIFAYVFGDWYKVYHCLCTFSSRKGLTDSQSFSLYPVARSVTGIAENSVLPLRALNRWPGCFRHDDPPTACSDSEYFIFVL